MRKLANAKLMLTVTLLCLAQFGVAQGLGFKSSHNTLIEDRTSYEVFFKNHINLNSQLSIAFDLSIVNPESFGYIMTVEIEQNKWSRIYSLSYLKRNNKAFLRLNHEGESNLLTIPINTELLGRANWLEAKVQFNFKKNEIIVTLNDTGYIFANAKLNGKAEACIFFGKNNNIIDVPEFAIKNLQVENENRKYSFDFVEDKGNTVHDNRGKAIGQVENPIWLINDSFHWKHIYSKACNSHAIVNYNSLNNQLVIAEKDSITFLHLNSGKTEKASYNNKMPLPLNLGMSVINRNKLIAYELKRIKFNEPTIATLDLDQLTWVTKGFSYLENERHHHNSHFKPANNKLLIFGGFGDKLFYNSFHEYNFESDTWQTMQTTGDKITPRFFSGMGRLGNQLIIFGGAGNKSGDQSIGKKYYYDCYAVDLDTLNVNKLWEISQNDTNFVSSRNLVFTSDSSAFYTIAYPEYEHNTNLRLYQYNLQNGKHKVFGDSIPMISEQIKSNANLYVNNDTKELYCVTQEYNGNDSCIVKLYSINNPPLSFADIAPQGVSTKKDANTIITIIVIIVGFFIFLFIIYKRKRSTNNSTSMTNDAIKLPKQNAIFLFGTFTVYDRKGKDIAYLFSPQMKYLFLFLLQKSLVEEKGVSSEQMYHLIWPDKEPKSAKNIKGVTLNKIRKAIEDVDGIQLLFENKQFKLHKEEPLYCDYLNFVSLLEASIGGDNDENNKILSQIISRGQFLLGTEVDFLDPFKGLAANQVVILGSKILKHYYKKRDFESCINFARSLYKVDELNESAFYFTIQSLLKQNKNSEAKNHFAKYSVKYFEFHNHEFQLLYTDVVKASSKHINNYMKEISY